MRIFGPEPLFRDRRDAGGALAARLERYRGRDPLVLGLPRGGVVVAAEVARRLDAELDVAVARKLGSPISPELAIGAVTASGERFLNEQLIRELDVSEAYLNDVTVARQREARRREAWLRGNRPPPRIAGRSVIVVDDGLATGATMRAAVRSVRKQSPAISWSRCRWARGRRAKRCAPRRTRWCASTRRRLSARWGATT